MTRIHFFLHILLLWSRYGTCQSFINPIIGFFPGTSTIPSKHRYNITIAFIFPYKSFWNFTTMEEYKACGGFCSWMRQMDSGAEMAVSEINNNPHILPEITVNILRVQGWDQKLAPGNGIGGVAPVALELSELKSVIGAVGDVADQSSMITAGILSQYKIPLCGGTPNLPALSNKANYPYYFRVTFSNKWGNDIATLLRKWNVKRLAMVYDADDSESVGACLDIKQSLFSNNILILARRSYHGLSYHNDYEDIIKEFLLVDARYIILCAQAWSNSYYLIETAFSMGMISPNNQWIVTQPPYPPDYSGSGADPRLDKITGMIWVTPKNESPTNPNFVAIQSRWENLYRTDPLKYQIDHFTWTNEGTYDCVGTMLYGLDALLKQNPNATSEMLANFELQSLLTFDKFRNSGFNGTLLNPMQLDTSGDIAANTIFLALNSSFWVNGTLGCFGEVDKFTGEFINHGIPQLYGGGSVPPLDGSQDDLAILSEITINTAQGQLLAVLIISGYLIFFGYMYALLKFRTCAIIKQLQIRQTILSTIGSGISISSLVLYFNVPTLSICFARQWLSFIGETLIITPLIMKTILIHSVYAARSNKRSQMKQQNLFLLGLTGVLVLVNIALLGWWQSYHDYAPVHYIVHGYEFHECTSSFKSGSGNALVTLYIFHALILLALLLVAVMTHQVNAIYNETSFLILLTFLLGILATILRTAPFDQLHAIKQAVVFWIVAVCVPIVRITPKLIEIKFSRYNLRQLLSRTNSTVRTSQWSSREFQKKPASTATNRSNVIKSVEINRAESELPRLRLYTKSLDEQQGKWSFRVAKGRVFPRWSNWFSVSAVTMMLLHKRLWIELASEEQTFAFPMFEDIQVEICGTRVLWALKSGIRKNAKSLDVFFQGYRFEGEFGLEEEARGFVAAFQEIQASPLGMPE